MTNITYKEFEKEKEELQKNIQQEIRNIEFTINCRLKHSYDIEKLELILAKLKVFRIEELNR